MKLQNKKTGQIKYFVRRDEFINFLLNQTKQVVVHDLKTMTKEELAKKYLPNWFIVARD